MYHVIESKKTHIGRFNIVQDQIEKGGEIYPYSYIEFKEGTCIIPFTDKEHVLLLEEYRHSIKQWVYNFPGGMVAEQEAPAVAAERELLEETGYVCREIIDLGYTYPSFGSTTEKIYLFAALVEKQHTVEREALELMKEKIVSVDEVEKMICDSTFVHGAGQAAWLKWKMRGGEEFLQTVN